MEFRLYAIFRTLVGQASLDIKDPRIDTLRKALDGLFGIYPELRPQLLDGNDCLRQDVPIFVNGRNPRLSEAGINLHLEPEDVISLFSPISSGRMNVEVLREPAYGKQEQTS
jgi:molybdopterin converting factor small subunit